MVDECREWVADTGLLSVAGRGGSGAWGASPSRTPSLPLPPPGYKGITAALSTCPPPPTPDTSNTQSALASFGQPLLTSNYWPASSRLPVLAEDILHH